MSRLRITALAAALIGAASLAAAAAAGPASAAARPQAQIRPYSITGHGFGHGATAAAAEQAAVVDLHGDYSGCGTPGLVSDTQQADGTWYAQVVATCKFVNVLSAAPAHEPAARHPATTTS